MKKQKGLALLIAFVLVLTSVCTTAVFADETVIDGVTKTVTFMAQPNTDTTLPTTWADFSNSGLQVSNALTTEKWFYRQSGENNLTQDTNSTKYSGEIVFDFSDTAAYPDFRDAVPSKLSFYIATGGNYDKNNLTKNPPPSNLVKIEYMNETGNWNTAEMSFSWSNTASKKAANVNATGSATACVLISGTIPEGTTASKVKIWYNILTRSDYESVNNKTNPSIAICAPSVTYTKTSRAFAIDEPDYVFAGDDSIYTTFDAQLSETDKNASDKFYIVDGKNNKIAVSEITETIDAANENVGYAFKLSDKMNPLTGYTFVMDSSVRTVGGNEYDNYTAEFATLPECDRITYTHDGGDSSWMGLDQVYGEGSGDTKLYTTSGSQGYMAFSFMFDGSKKRTMDDGTVYDFYGVPTSLKFYAGFFETDALKNAAITATLRDNSTVSLGTLADYASYSEDAKAYVKSDASPFLVNLWGRAIPRNTKKIYIKWTNSKSGGVSFSKPVVTYNVPKYGFAVSGKNGKVSASDTLNLVFNTDVSSAGTYTVSANGATAATSTAAAADGKNVTVTLDSAIEPDMSYTLTANGVTLSNGLKLYSSEVSFDTGAPTTNISIIDSTFSADWVKLGGDIGKITTSVFSNQYAMINEKSGSIIFDFGGNTTAVIGDNSKYLKGYPAKIQFGARRYGSPLENTSKIYTSANGTDWKELGTFADFKTGDVTNYSVTVNGITYTDTRKDEYSGVKVITLGSDVLGENVRYVKLEMTSVNNAGIGILLPTVEFVQDTPRYEIINLTKSVDAETGKLTANGGIRFNYDGGKANADVCVITAVYGADGALKDAEINNFAGIAKGESRSFENELDVSAGNKLKVFVLDSIDGIRPLIDLPVEVNIQ